MTDDQFYTSLSANTIMAKLTNHVQRTNFITSSTDKYYSLDSEDDFRSGCWNVSHQQQFFSELPSLGRSHNTNYWYSWVQTIYHNTFLLVRSYGVKQLFFFLHVQGQKREQKPTTKNFVGFYNHAPLLTMLAISSFHGYVFLWRWRE